MSVTIEGVAEEADVSITTVSAVINDTRYVSPELTDRVNKAVEKLNYYPDQLGRGLRKGKSNTVGLLISDITNPFFPRVARGVEDCVRENYYNLILGNTDENPKEEKHYISLLQSQQVDGVIIAPTAEGSKNIDPIVEESLPTVLIDRFLEDKGIPSVASDNYSGAYKAVEYLIEKGHRKIGFVGGLKGVQSTNRRYQGYREALKDKDIGFNEGLVVMGNAKVKDSHQATEKLLAEVDELTAIFAANNLILIGVLQSLKERSISCPDQISVICFDEPKWGSAVTPAITSIAQKPYEMGYQAGQRLFELMESSQTIGEDGKITLSTELKERGSVKELA